MKVVLVASTALALSGEAATRFALEESGYVPHDYLDLVHPVDELAEAAGRGCYESWNRPNPVTATNSGYLNHILDVGHLSVLEHGSATFYISGVSRSLLTELSRHRHFSYSVLSQRYVDQDTEDIDTITPPLFDLELDISLQQHAAHSRILYSNAVEKLRAQGYSRKQARGAARAFLPEATETKLLLTGNMRTFLEFIPKRNSDSADEEIKILAKELLRQLKGVAPNIFQKLKV